MDGSVLLSAADRQLESVLPGDRAKAFDDNLIQAILFHEKVLLPDIFAFISSVMFQRQSEPKESRLEQAIKNGLVVSALRSQCSTFKEALALIKDQDIQGLQSSPDVTAERLDEALGASGMKPINWPDDISKKYGSLLLSSFDELMLMADYSPDRSPRLQQQCLLMKKFATTTDFVGLCKDSTSESNKGLRRGDVCNVLLKILNSKEASGTSNKVNDSKRELVDHPACQQNPDLKKTIEGYVSIANVAYHMNMADSFRGGAYLADDLYADSALVGVVAGVSAKRRLISDTVCSGTPTGIIKEYTRTVSIPSVSQLREVPWEELVSIRKDEGYGYFAALKAWRENPDSSHTVMDECLDKYASALTSQVKSKAPLVKVLLRKFPYSDNENLKKAYDFGLDCLSDRYKGPGRLFFSAIGALSNIFYSWASDRPVKVRHETRDGAVKTMIA